MRHTRGHTGNRRSHHALTGIKVIKDKESGNLRLPHHIDEVTGMYRGNKIFTPVVKKEKVLKTHEHTHGPSASEVENKTEGKKGIMGKIAAAARPRSRSGMGGGV